MKLSVIIPVYNAAHLIESFFENHFSKAPDLSDVEFIFINDGATDDSYEIVSHFIEKYKNCSDFKIISKPNGGAASARNTGIRIATGAYLAYVDIDDRIELKGLLSLCELAMNKDLDILGFTYDYIRLNGETIKDALKHPIPYNVIDSGTFFLEKGYQPSSVCVFLIKRAFVLKHKLTFVEGITHEDVELSFRYMLHAEQVYFTREVLYHYYQQEESVTNQLTGAKKKKYLSDEVTIAVKMQEALHNEEFKKWKHIIEANYNSVVWNLLYGMLQDPYMLDLVFVKNTLSHLSEKGLYPIKGPLKTKFQSYTKYIFNLSWLYLWLVDKKLKRNKRNIS